MNSARRGGSRSACGCCSTSASRRGSRPLDGTSCAALADIPETTRLAFTIETWWPAIEVALVEGVSNGRTEGFNRVIKQTKRVACGFRNMDHYRTRIMDTSRFTRTRRDAA